MTSTTDQPGVQIFEAGDSKVGKSSYVLFLVAIVLFVFAIEEFVAVFLGAQRWQSLLYVTTTVPLIIGVALLAEGFFLRNLPRRIVIGTDEIEIVTQRSTKRYAWSEIGSATTTGVLIGSTTWLGITDTAGNTIIWIDESFPNYQRLVELVQHHVEAKPDDLSEQILIREAKLMGGLCFCLSCFFGIAAMYIALTAREEHRTNTLLHTKGVTGEGEIVRRFVAANGTTRRIEYRISGSRIKDVEVEPAVWDQLEKASTVSVVYVPDEPDINRLEFGEVGDKDLPTLPWGKYILSGIGGLIALFLLAFSPFVGLGYDLEYDEKQRIWILKRYDKVIWTSQPKAATET